MHRALIAIALLTASTAVAVDIDPTKVVDLTYPFGADTIYWPTAKHFALDEVHRGDACGYWYRRTPQPPTRGTHMDAPVISWAAVRPDQVPVTAGITRWRVDVSAQARDADTG